MAFTLTMAVGPGAILALGSALVSGAFAVLVFRQFIGRRRAYQLAWGVGLALFALASALEYVSELAGGWTEPLYRTYFALHPTLVAVLGLGTIYLLANKKVGHAFLAYILVIFAILLFFTATAVIAVSESEPGRILCGPEAEVCEQGRIVGGTAMPDSVRSLSQLFTYPGAIALIGGAIYSWRKTRSSYNLLIAVGAILMTIGGILTRYVSPEFLYIFLLAGIAVMFGGFLRSLEVSRAPSPEPTPSSLS